MNRFIPPCATLAALLLAGSVAAAADAADAHSRAPTAQETASFSAFYAKRYGSVPVAPVFRVHRPDAKSPWQVEASVDLAPRRGLRNLCRADRLAFTYSRRWTGAPPRQLVWLGQGTCTANPHAAELLHRMPDTDVLALLGAQAAALPKGRLIMAGNSGCAASRSLPFRFAAIDVGNAGTGAEEMAGLVYRSERGVQVTVWVRKNGAAIDNWGVSCAPAGTPSSPASS